MTRTDIHFSHTEGGVVVLAINTRPGTGLGEVVQDVHAWLENQRAPDFAGVRFLHNEQQFQIEGQDPATDVLKAYQDLFSTHARSAEVVFDPTIVEKAKKIVGGGVWGHRTDRLCGVFMDISNMTAAMVVNEYVRQTLLNIDG